MSNLSGTTVIAATSNDPNHPPHNILDRDENSYWCSTGLFPQEFVLSFPSNLQISTVHIQTRNCKQITLLSCEKHLPIAFDSISTVQIPNSNSIQRESIDINNPPVSRYLKVRIDSATTEFAAVYNISVEGKPQ